MTDLLDPPIASAIEPEVASTAPVPAKPPTASADRWLLASLLLGAAAIHLVMAPSHLDESTVEGVGFLAAACALVWAAAISEGGSPRRSRSEILRRL